MKQDNNKDVPVIDFDNLQKEDAVIDEETLKQIEKTMDEFIRLAKQGANVIMFD